VLLVTGLLGSNHDHDFERGHNIRLVRTRTVLYSSLSVVLARFVSFISYSYIGITPAQIEVSNFRTTFCQVNLISGSITKSSPVLVYSDAERLPSLLSPALEMLSCSVFSNTWHDTLVNADRRYDCVNKCIS
jgi:hypothetical protein